MASGIFPYVSYAELSATLIIAQFGITGGTIFDICLIFTCLMTAVGLLAGAATFISDASNNHIPYKIGVFFCLITSFFISCIGLDAIITWLTPTLQFIYPPCIALTLCYVFAPNRVTSMRFSCIFTAIWAFIDMLSTYLDMNGFSSLNMYMDFIPKREWGGLLCLGNDHRLACRYLF